MIFRLLRKGLTGDVSQSARLAATVLVVQIGTVGPEVACRLPSFARSAVWNRIRLAHVEDGCPMGHTGRPGLFFTRLRVLLFPFGGDVGTNPDPVLTAPHLSFQSAPGVIGEDV